MNYEQQSWEQCVNSDLWVFDKLILSRKLQYTCGPIGVNVPNPGNYIVRPTTNFLGMGIGANFVYIEDSTDHLPPGYFWCEIFEGRHLSVDYYQKKQILCVEGTRRTPDILVEWDKWERTNDTIQFPPVLNRLNKMYSFINCEFIGGNLIEVHLRKNFDFTDGCDIIYPVWTGESVVPPEGMIFESNKDHTRLGFFKSKQI